MFFKMKSWWQGLGRLFSNLGATLVLASGIAIMAIGIVGALWMMPTAFLPTLFSALGSFIGAFIIAGALHRFVFSPSGDKAKLEEAEAATREEQRKNRELSEALEKVKAEKEELQHRLTTFANVTEIQPVMKLVTGELSFDITDFCEKRLDDDKPGKHLLSGKLHETPEFFRGVYRYSGKLNLAVDLAKIKVVETDDAITICGPFEYEPLLDLDHKAEWLMHGRREQEFRHGQTEKGMETCEIKVIKPRDPDFEDEQVAALHENLKYLKIIDSMKTFTDKIVVEFVKLMLAPTGKAITYSPTANEAFSTKTLNELVTAYNNRIKMHHQSGNVTICS